jgi:hypothetical protein
MSNKLVLDFNDGHPEQNGMKFVVFKINEPGKNPSYDFGWCYWDGWEWGNMSESGLDMEVVKWAEMPNANIVMM